MKNNDQFHQNTSLREFLLNVKPYISFFIQKKIKIIWFNIIVFGLGVAYILFFIEPKYKSNITILPDYGSETSILGSLSGIASMAGLNVGKSSQTQIYEELIYSETVLRDIINSKYQTDKFADSVNLIDYFSDNNEISELTEYEKRKQFLTVFKKLKNNNIKTSFDRTTKILTISVYMPEPKLSAQTANKLVQALDKYVRQKRKSNSKEKRIYLEKRIVQVNDSLKLVEKEMEIFSSTNRMILQSPKLKFQYGKLRRKLEIFQTVYIELVKHLEIAKLDEIKDSPIINIKEKANYPVKKEGPRKLFYLIVILAFSLSCSLLFYLLIYFYLKNRDTFKEIID